MLKSIAKLVGYTKAPKATTVLLHPVKGTAALLAWKGVKNAEGKAKALVGAAVALPLLAYLVRR